MFNIFFAIAYGLIAVLEFPFNEKYPKWFRIPATIFFGFIALLNLLWAIEYGKTQGLLP